MPKKVGAHRLVPTRPVREVGPAQEYYDKLGARWPRTVRRKYWTWLFDLIKTPFFAAVPPYRASEAWETGQHLPCMVRINYRTYMWTRWAVPIDADTTRMFYFHTAVRKTAAGRLYERLSYWLYHHWVLDLNFSAQDYPAARDAYYDKPEFLAPTDAQLVQWRRFLLSARGMAKDG